MGLDPSHAARTGKAVRAPHLEFIVLEYQGSHTIGTLKASRLRLEEKLLALKVDRLSAGAVPIQKVTLRSFSLSDFPEVLEYPQTSSGIHFRLEITEPINDSFSRP